LKILFGKVADEVINLPGPPAGARADEELEDPDRRTQGTSGRSPQEFVLINEYSGRLPVHHVDAYRTESLSELLDLGLLNLMGGSGVTLVEWADKCGSLLPPGTVRVAIEGVGDEPRTITIARPDTD